MWCFPPDPEACVCLCVFFLVLTPWLLVTNNLKTTGLPWAGHTTFLKVCVFAFLFFFVTVRLF